MFLQGSGGALLSIPFLPSLMPRTAWAQTTPTPKRFLSLLNRQDIGHNANWLPGGVGNTSNIPQPNRTFSGANGDLNFRWQPLREFAPTSSSFLAPLYGTSGTALSPYLESINIMRSLDCVERRGHDCSKVLGGIDSGPLTWIPTIDQVINNKIGEGRAVIFAGDTGMDYFSLSTDPTFGSARATSLEVSINTIYNTIFRNNTFPDANSIASPTSRRDVLTRVLGDFNRVINSRNISSLDKVVLTNAMDKMSDVQRSLSALPSAQCIYKNLAPTVDRATWAMSTDPAVGKALADIITAAILCDAARVFTIGCQVFEGMMDGENIDHQKTSHTPWAPTVANGKFEWQNMGARHALIYQYFIGPLIQNLSSATDATNGKSLLYNSLIYCGNESGQVHGWASQPVIMAGNAGGAITTGNYIDYTDRARGAFEGNDVGLAVNGNIPFTGIPGDTHFTNNWYGALYNRWLVTCLQAMGLQPQDYENNAIEAQLCNRTDIGAQNANLSSLGGYGYAMAFDINDPNNSPNDLKAALAKYDLKTFRYKLPLP